MVTEVSESQENMSQTKVVGEDDAPFLCQMVIVEWLAWGPWKKVICNMF
jgi:hypothetical protein